MHTELNKGTALFFFAHQDDEVGVFQRILDCRAWGMRVICAYLTDGQTGKVQASQRNAESIHVLSQLGVAREDIIFAGENLGISDGHLALNLSTADQWISQWIAGIENISLIHVLAWEGGHHDHDALNALVTTIAADNGLLDRLYQFPLYNAAGCPAPLFRVLTPLKANGVEVQTRISWSNRIKFLTYCLSYPSQMKTWIGLFPFVCLYMGFAGTQKLQPVSLARNLERPHSGPLYYETRKFSTWEELSNLIKDWRMRRVSAPI